MRDSVQPSERRRVGFSWEDRAADYLRRQGLDILERNVESKLGELDIVARDQDTLVFVEVRGRTHPDEVHPACTVTRKKQLQVVRCAQLYCLQQHIPADVMIRFDVVAVLGPEGELEWFENAFEAGR